MQLHEIHPIYKPKRRKRVGRGGKRGTYAGRGIKGQKARAGRRLKPAIRELIKRYPKLRGYRFKKRKLKPAIVNVETLEKKFQAGEVVNPKVLLEKKLIRRISGRLPKVKILGKGKLSKSLTIENCLVSKKAKEIIEGASGTVRGRPKSEGGRGNLPVSPCRKTASEASVRNRGFLKSEPEASDSERLPKAG